MEPKPYQISGCEVVFPRQPYGVQLAFMAKLIKALDTGHNALLEAPTGCGKTLAILCGALAWQEKMKSAQKGDDFSNEKSLAELAVSSGAADTSDLMVDTLQDSQVITPGTLPEAPEYGSGLMEKKVVPTIYYCTRTHSQIAQVVKELKGAGYTPVMACLGAKRHYCINKEVMSKDSIDLACDQLRDTPTGCRFFNGYQKAVSIAKTELKVHDIEDLSEFGRGYTACPYFLARTLSEDAELVFCPYNYVIDPGIRSATGIDISGSIVIFDEGHNIEDVARDAGSIDVRWQELQDAYQDTIKPASKADVDDNGNQDKFFRVQAALCKIRDWLVNHCSDPSVVPQVEPLRFQRIWDGSEIQSVLARGGLDRISVSNLHQTVEQLEMSLKKQQEAQKGFGPGTKSNAKEVDKSGSLAISFLKRMTMVLKMMYDFTDELPRQCAASNYRLVMTRWKERPKGAMRRGSETQHEGNEFQMEFSLWCLNPACVFREIGEKSRSVIVTSGTLSPMTSFASELGVEFESVLEGAHVVPKQQAKNLRDVLWPDQAEHVGAVCFCLSMIDGARKYAWTESGMQVSAMTISRCPGDRLLKATYNASNTPAFQDGVGKVLLRIAEAVPDGMLVFMPSYTMMDKLCSRWHQTGAWKALNKVKRVWREPHGNDELEREISGYYEAIKKHQGGMFIAVCRGKVSEGINFADANARAVVLLGIPYPAFKDAKVVEKKKFNDHAANRSLGLITGEQWYSLQAFRAMNQALGRCIRHRSDFGAIILLDERLRSLSIQKNLSRWLRGQIRESRSTNEACTHLNSFFVSCQHLEAKQCEGDIQVKTDNEGEDLDASTVAGKSASTRTSARQRWANSGNKKQISIAQSLTNIPKHNVKQDKPEVKYDGLCDNEARATCCTQPCGTSHGAPSASGASDMKGAHPTVRPTQPAESVSLGAWAQPQVYKRALQLLEEGPKRDVVSTAAIDEHGNGGTALLTSQTAIDSSAAVARSEDVPCCIPNGKRSREERCSTEPGEVSPSATCAGGAQAENNMMPSQTPSRAARGGTCYIHPSDAEFLMSGFMDDDLDADEEVVDAGDRHVREITAETTAVATQPWYSHHPLPHVPASDVPTQMYPSPNQQAQLHTQFHSSQKHIAEVGPAISHSLLGQPLCPIQNGQPVHSQQVAAQCQGTAMHHVLHGAHQQGVRCGHGGTQSWSGTGCEVVQAPLHQDWETVWYSACAQWLHIDATSFSHAVRSTLQMTDLADGAEDVVKRQTSSQLKHALATAQQSHQQGQLVDFLCRCTTVPCGLAIVLRYAQMEPGMPGGWADAMADLLSKSMQPWRPDQCTLAATRMLSQWHVGVALCRLTDSYTLLLRNTDQQQNGRC